MCVSTLHDLEVVDESWKKEIFSLVPIASLLAPGWRTERLGTRSSLDLNSSGKLYEHNKVAIIQDYTDAGFASKNLNNDLPYSESDLLVRINDLPYSESALDGIIIMAMNVTRKWFLVNIALYTQCMFSVLNCSRLIHQH